MALVLTLKKGQSLLIGSSWFSVGQVYDGQSFQLLDSSGVPFDVNTTRWTELLPGQAWVMASNTRRLDRKEVGLMVNAPEFFVSRGLKGTSDEAGQ